ncbi:P-loop containing nucleoside triphosphate hydrolase [Phytophthora cactorum]|nr:P-loop containing nucleoside triphosphate hydrolase [Phytophthora cactorum]
MAAAGRWQREYERDWRDYARQVIVNHFGKYALQCSPAVTQADERQLREVLAAVGIKHAPPNHSRWQAPIPASQTLSAPQDSPVSEGQSQSMFPAFNSQDFVSQSTPQRRVSASQRLQLRMADVSPIADSRRTSIECAGTISPPSGAAKSPWTPGQWKDATNTSSVAGAEFQRDLDVSMHSMQLSDEENEQTQMDEEAEDTQMIDVSEAHEEEGKAAVAMEEDCGEEEKQVQIVECEDKGVDGHAEDLMVDHNDDAEEMNVSKELVFSSDSEEDEGEEKDIAETEAVFEVEKENVGAPIDAESGDQPVHRSPPPEDTTERPPWASEPDFEFGDGIEYGDEDQQQEDEQQDVEMLEPEQRAVETKLLENQLKKTHEITAKQNEPPAKSNTTPTLASAKSKSISKRNHPGTTKRSTFASPTAPQFEEGRTQPPQLCQRGSEHMLPRQLFDETDNVCFSNSFVSEKSITWLSCTFGKASSTNPPTAPPSSRSALSRKRANRGALLHTKLPLEMEYRFASDRRRRHRRRKSLAAKPGVFPYVVPELMVELQPYQKEALQWMLEREKDPGDPVTIDQQRRGDATAVDALVAKVCGGVLADEMGLGKTVCCLALICESLRQARAADAQARSKTGSTVPRLTPPSLIVTPLSILSQWEQEIRAKTNLSVVTYQGATRKSFRSATQFMGADIVLSTYDTLRLLECKVRDKDSDDDDGQGNGDGTAEDGWHQVPRLTPQSKKSVVTSKLHQLQWFRVILDESHLIANAGCARARAAFSLGSQRRWCVTGTPIQNGTADLAALLQFVGLGNRAHALSERELGALSTLDAHSRAPILDLPEKTEETIELEFASDVERALYMLLHRSTKRQVLRYLQSKEAKQNGRVPLTTPTKDGEDRPLFMHVFELILRLRQVCDACALVTADPLAEVQTRADSAEALVGNGRDGISPFSTGEAELLKHLQEQRSDTNAVAGCGPLESTKLTALMKELKRVRARRERVLVISQWTSFLDMIAERLEAHNTQCEDASETGNMAIAFAKLDGRMPAKDREQVVRNFQQQEDTAAHVFIMEPSWNPSLDRQAIDRAHRFGQTREVRVVRFIMKGSIEERVVELQNKKRQLTAAFLGDGDILSSAKKKRLRKTRLSTGDLRRLFFTQQEQEEERLRHQHDEDDEGAQRAEDSDGNVTCIEISDSEDTSE